MDGIKEMNKFNWVFTFILIFYLISVYSTTKIAEPSDNNGGGPELDIRINLVSSFFLFV